MDRICTVHIGLHKTGSTSIQKMLAAEESRLRECGIVYPKTGRNGPEGAHHLLAWELNRKPGFDGSTHFNALADELESAKWPDRVILSSENFSAHIDRPRLMARLRRKIERLGYRLRIIAYVRPQEAALQSLYTQKLKALKLSHDFETFWPKAIRSAGLNYEIRFASALDLLGQDLRVFPFCRDVTAQGLCRHFLRAIDAPLDALAGFVEPPPANVSPGPRMIAAALAISRKLEEHGVDLKHANLEAIAQVMRQMSREIGSDEGKFSALTPEIAATIRAWFHASNARFAGRVFGCPWDEVFAAEIADIPPLNVFEPEDAPLDERRAFDDFVEGMVEAVLDLVIARGRSAENEAGFEPEQD
jgi:hypothetical protein